jgi:hypothetical protein
MKNDDTNYDADNEMYDNELGIDSFVDIGEYISQKNININYEHNTSMFIASEEIKKSKNIVEPNYHDNEISIDVFIAIGEYMIERNMKYDLYLAEIKNNMNNVIKQIKELNNDINDKINSHSDDDSDSDNIIHAYFYVSSDEPELSNEERATNKYTDSDDLVYPGIHDNN